jgi:hypothetical protein
VWYFHAKTILFGDYFLAYFGLWSVIHSKLHALHFQLNYECDVISKPTNQPLLSLTDNLDLLILNRASHVLLWSLFLCPYSDRWLQVWLYHNQLLKRAGRGGPYIECWLQVWLYYDRFLKGAGRGVCIMHNQLPHQEKNHTKIFHNIISCGVALQDQIE